MIIGGLVEVFLGIDAEGKPLEQGRATAHQSRFRRAHTMTLVRQQDRDS
jgi:hypothetical protein